jgi:hypothetical protein
MREWSRGLSMRQNGLNPAADVEVDSVTLGVQGAWMGLFALKETRSNCAAPRAYDCLGAPSMAVMTEERMSSSET